MYMFSLYTNLETLITTMSLTCLVLGIGRVPVHVLQRDATCNDLNASHALHRFSCFSFCTIKYKE